MTANQLNEAVLRQLDELVDEFELLRKRSQHDDCSDVIYEPKAFEIATRAYAAIERVSGARSPYCRRAEEIRQEKAYEQLKVLRLVGVVSSLRADLKAGYLSTIEEMIHGEMFGDFLEMV